MEPSPSPAQAPFETPPPTAMSLTARLANVIAAPGEVFEYVKTAPASANNWLVPAVLAVLIGWASALLIFSQPAIQQQLAEISEHAIEKQIEKMKASEQQAEQMRAAAAKYGAIGQKVSMVAAPVFAAFASPFFWGFIVWLGGAKIFKGNFPYMKAVETVGLGNMIGVLDAIVKSLLIMVMGSIWASPSLGLLVRDFDPQKPLHGVLSAVNIMTFWLLTVRAVGLSRLSGASFLKSAVWVFGIWLGYTSLFMGIGFALQAVFSR